MKIRLANQKDVEGLLKMDSHITKPFLTRAIEEKRVLLAESEEVIGWLRYSYFWESIPFMDMLFVKNEQRQLGYGSALIDYFEKDVKARGFKTVMTSTSALEHGQHLYYRLGYQSVGGFFPRDEPYELLLRKDF